MFYRLSYVRGLLDPFERRVDGVKQVLCLCQDLVDASRRLAADLQQIAALPGHAGGIPLLIGLGPHRSQFLLAGVLLAGLFLQLHDAPAQRDRIVSFCSCHGITNERPQLGRIDWSRFDLMPMIVIGRGSAVVVGADAGELDQFDDIGLAGDHPSLAGLQASQRPGDLLRDVLGDVPLKPFLDRRLIGRQRQPVRDQRFAAAEHGVMQGLGPLRHHHEADALGPPGGRQFLREVDGQVLAAEARPLLRAVTSHKYLSIPARDKRASGYSHIPDQAIVVLAGRFPHPIHSPFIGDIDDPLATRGGLFGCCQAEADRYLLKIVSQPTIVTGIKPNPLAVQRSAITLEQTLEQRFQLIA
ncbi:MAG TPA: hypothetical protein VM659_28815 [Dongiaceae bacterium]|nr:hypothetical protein [Dongiaceae bacterium]